MNYGKSMLDVESFLISVALCTVVTLVIFCIMASILNKDFEVLGTLRQHYRTRVAQVRRRLRSVNYAQVGPDGSRDVDPTTPLRREATWKKVQGDVFRRP
mmetsp:Transcript_23545/g.27510  ORF Transcript_23545/g.27510 Transcript_23545/m.27510 type:complete len:100 (+) Transcript_23545:89-388(+)